MRLINADTVKAVFEEKSSVAVCGVELCKAIISRIDEVPTVDAIPVEWINRWYDRYMYAEVGDLLNDWMAERKEE